jgi:hypothetical protein
VWAFSRAGLAVSPNRVDKGSGRWNRIAYKWEECDRARAGKSIPSHSASVFAHAILLCSSRPLSHSSHRFLLYLHKLREEAAAAFTPSLDCLFAGLENLPCNAGVSIGLHLFANKAAGRHFRGCNAIACAVCHRRRCFLAVILHYCCGVFCEVLVINARISPSSVSQRWQRGNEREPEPESAPCAGSSLRNCPERRPDEMFPNLNLLKDPVPTRAHFLRACISLQASERRCTVTVLFVNHRSCHSRHDVVGVRKVFRRFGEREALHSWDPDERFELSLAGMN